MHVNFKKLLCVIKDGQHSYGDFCCVSNGVSKRNLTKHVRELEDDHFGRNMSLY
jgi:hypothetical protein